ncbi:dihydrodipicolinate synthase family protein [Sinomicrobium soli]|uniref:dihydrodipicolinate synthase family protein n=1 Tax=Sinomicrobium sp. N-1-3-6 TaxID=2219864 RepID=UPI000DCC9CCE|nr:dihydrodipicolinate synthase family protein [Sinomicrobium sp. N-1-3-6]RAV30347.1 dihydrodipicolinate synthase family protein [Sinomicrobium sp. N-1-3-6]
MQDTLNIKGIIPPMVTPLTSEQEIDLEGTQKLVEHLVNGGVHGIFILGTTGEAASLSLEKRLRFMQEVLQLVDNKVPVLVGITDSIHEVSLEIAEKAGELGASAVVSAPPFYYTLGQEELIDYYEGLADRSPLPVFLYNMPSNTKIYFELKTVMRLAQHPNIIGLKDSSGDSKYFQNLIFNLKEIPGFSLYVGPEEILAETALMGGSGGICGGANLFPELYVQLYESVVQKEYVRVMELQRLVMEISNHLYTVGKHQSSYLKGVKAALDGLGLCRNIMALPLQAFREKEYRIICNHLDFLRDKVNAHINNNK